MEYFNLSALEGVSRYFDGFLPLFYLVSPNASSFERLEQVPKYVEQTTPYFFILIFIEVIIRWLQGLPHVRLNDAFGSVAHGMFMITLSVVLFRGIEVYVYVWVFENMRLVMLPWQSPITWWISFLAFDCGYYWFHRLAHEISIFWMAHQVHHSSEEYNLSTALRQSSLQRLTSFWVYLPLALGIPPTHYLVHKQLNLLYQFWIHTECIDRLGPLEYILNTPSHHRVHHGRNRYCINKNYGTMSNSIMLLLVITIKGLTELTLSSSLWFITYIDTQAGVLIIWDRIFGTFEPEGDKIYYGLVHTIKFFNPFWAQVHYIVYIAKKFWSINGLRNKLYVLIKGPSWYIGKPRLGNLKDVPEVPNDTIPYNPVVPWWVSIYAFIHFMVLIILTQFYVVNSKEIPYLMAVGVTIYILLCLTSLGMIFDCHPACALVEVSRLLLGWLVVTFIKGPSMMSSLHHGLQVFLLTSITIWSMVLFRQIILTRNKEKLY